MVVLSVMLVVSVSVCLSTWWMFFRKGLVLIF